MISPTELSDEMKDLMNTQLPKGKTIIDVFTDFMRYLFDSTKELFKASEPSGELRWESVSDAIELVLAHPNEWRGPQQTQLRTAAVRAGIVPDTPAGRSRVHFVTEGEASFNFCATNTEAGQDLKVCYPALIQSQPFEILAGWRASFDHRCGWWDDRYQHLRSSQQWAAAGRRTV